MLLSKTRSLLRSFSFPTWSIPIALLILTLLSYGLRIFSLGFYWDDWPYLWIFNRLGPSGIIQAFAGDRPFLSFIYIISLSVLGHSIPGWQIFGLLARWLCSLGLWWALSLTWPLQKHKVTWAIFLFTVYPGFTQQWISVIYAQAFFLWAALFFSIGITLWLARRRPSRPLIIGGTVLALALSAFTMFSTEYFFGLELLRPALLWLVFSDSAAAPHSERWKVFRQRFLKVAAWWVPYLALMLVFVYWRSFIHVFVGYQTTTLQGLEQAPLSALWQLALAILKDMIVSTLAAWGQPLQLDTLFRASPDIWLRPLAVILITGFFATLYLAWLRPRFAHHAQNEGVIHAPIQPANPDHWAVQAILVGLFAMLISGWPFWITQLPLRMGFPQDRFSLPLSVGVCLLLAGLVDAAGKNLARKALILGMIVALAAGFHFNTADAYREDWTLTRDFFWQLAWRAPAIQPDTLLLSTSMPFKYFEDDSLTAPLNWTFDPDGTSTQMNYILYDLRVRYHNLPSLIPGNPVEKDFRGVQFTGSTSRVLVFYYAPPGCVRILDPVYDADLYNLPEPLLANISLSDPGNIIQDQDSPAAPPPDIFGSEPKHRWCYFFEKADLARQNGDWEAITKLSQQSIRKGYRPEDPAEYLPFIEGYNRTGHWADSYELTLSAFEGNSALSPALCAAWRRSASDAIQNGVDTSGGLYGKVNTLLHCPTP